MTDIIPNLLQRPQKEPEGFFRELDLQLLIHELKGPLSIIETTNRMLLQQQPRFGQLNDTQQRSLGRSLRCSAKLRDLIHTILEVGRCELGRICLTRFDVPATIKKIIVDLLETEFCKLSGEIQADTDALTRQAEFMEESGVILDILPEVERIIFHQDRVKFGHIVNNLVRNALQHMNSRVEIQVAVKGSHLEIRVSDDGDGIAPEDQSELFQIYASTTPNHAKTRTTGHGIGLAGSRILARRIGGDITVDTNIKMGSSFLVHLPMTLEC
jgi:signal transduction histidine kinase